MQSLLSVILMTVHMMLALALIGVVLLQRSEGGMGGLGGGGGMSGFMTTRGSANLLTRTTRWLAGTFMVTSLVLAWLAVHAHTANPPLVPQAPPVEAPMIPAPGQTGGGAGSSAPATNSSGAGSTTGAPATTGTAPAPSTTPAPGPTPSAPAVPTNQ